MSRAPTMLMLVDAKLRTGWSIDALVAGGRMNARRTRGDNIGSMVTESSRQEKYKVLLKLGLGYHLGSHTYDAVC